MERILVTGGSGKTGKRIAARIGTNRARIASRHPGPEGVYFDWTEPKTFEAALANVRAIYLTAPTRNGMQLEAMKPFLRQALSHGVKRFVLLSASQLPEGGPLMGAVHAFLYQEAPEWAVRRPSWFMQNFTEGVHFPTIRDEDTIYSATEDGRIAFIDAEDIASAAASLLLAPTAPNRDFVLTGPCAISYDEAATLISEAAGRSIRHHRISEAELAERWMRTGLQEEHARGLAAMDTLIANGAEDRITDGFTSITANLPRSFEAFVAGHSDAWHKIAIQVDRSDARRPSPSANHLFAPCAPQL